MRRIFHDGGVEMSPRSNRIARFSKDYESLVKAAAIALRLLDDVIDASRFPLPQQAEMARGTRRIGLGITGLADSLMLLGLLTPAAAHLRRLSDARRCI